MSYTRLIPCVLAVLLSGCSFREDKLDGDLAATSLDFETIRSRVLVPSCISCHGTSGGISFETYASVKQNLSAIEQAALIRKTMPKSAPLAPEAASLLSRWIKAGAPEFGPGSGLRADFLSLSEKVFQPKCVSCHSPGSAGAAKEIPLVTWDDLVQPARELIVPGLADESRLIQALVGPEESKRCPDAGRTHPLSSDEVEKLREWIRLGGQEKEHGRVAPVPTDLLSYRYVRQTVFAPRCLSCHNAQSEHSSFENYPETQGALPAIQWEALMEQTMPLGSELTRIEQKILVGWIKAGAPEYVGDPGPAPVDTSQLSFGLIRQRIFEPSCVRCHSAPELDLRSYESSKASLGKIAIVTLAEKTMPKGGPLPEADQDLLREWIMAGAPESSASEIPLEPKYVSILERVLKPRKCLECHGAAGTAPDVPLFPLKAMLDSPRQILIPKNVEESGLWIFTALVADDDDKLMPPKSTGPRLPRSELDVIKTWIEKGAPE